MGHCEWDNCERGTVSFAQAIAYFVHEACLSLVRSWKVSLVAVLTITVSLFLGGVFLIASGNLERVIRKTPPRKRLTVIVSTASRLTFQLRTRLRQASWMK